MINPSDPARSNDNYTCVASNGVLPDKKKSMTTGTAVTVVHCKFMFGCYCENAQWFINVCELLPKMAWNLRKIHLCHNIFLLHVWSSISFCVNRSTPYLRMQLKCWNNYLLYQPPSCGWISTGETLYTWLFDILASHSSVVTGEWVNGAWITCCIWVVLTWCAVLNNFCVLFTGCHHWFLLA